MTPREEYLEAENANLREQIASLTGRATMPMITAALGTSRAGARIIAMLIAREGRVVTKNTIYELVFQHHNGDGPCWKSIDVELCLMRRKLAAMGLPNAIDTHIGIGYAATPELLAWARGILQPEAVAA